ncbi:MAG: 3'(2'),5'-bisphosphate nucleotidase CysQ [Myxococcota bacterium]|nr:3'(2'),5'-bisphosphate nucleotidase CysQ [Myxococcota bacterium]
MGALVPSAENWFRELSTARRLVMEAGAIAMRFYQRDDLHISSKSGDEPVTAADHAVDEYLREGFSRAYPGYAVLTEESEDHPDRAGAERVWMIDPIDGTKEFVARNGEFCVMAGLTANGKPVLGVILHPVTGTLYYGGEGLGAHVQNGNTIRDLRASRRAALKEAVLALSRSHPSEVMRYAQEHWGCAEGIISGSAGLKAMLLALGRADVYAVPHGVKLWDLAAPHAILMAAGGKASDFRGEEIPYGVSDVLARHGVLFSNGLLHDVVLRELAKLPPRQPS